MKCVILLGLVREATDQCDILCISPCCQVLPDQTASVDPVVREPILKPVIKKIGWTCGSDDRASYSIIRHVSQSCNQCSFHSVNIRFKTELGFMIHISSKSFGRGYKFQTHHAIGPGTRGVVLETPASKSITPCPK